MSDTAKLTISQPNTGHATDPGRVRENNEDSFWVPPPELDKQLISAKGWLYIVADGMGGYQGGEVASAIVVKAASDSYYATPGDGAASTIMDSLRQAVLDSQQAVLKQQSEDPEHSQMGSTLVMAVIRDEELYVANLGDSRCYRLRDGALEQLSHDHSWVAEQVRSGLLLPDQVHGNVNRSLLTRALGQSNNIVKPEIEKLDWKEGDRLLLCSDGLWDMAPDDNIRILLSKPDPQEASQMLVDAANAAGGSDNITAVIVGNITPQEAPVVATAVVPSTITSKLTATPSTPASLSRSAIIAVAAIIIVILAALIIVSQVSVPAAITPKGTTGATTVAAVQRSTAVPIESTATAEIPAATTTAPPATAAKPTVTVAGASTSPTVTATQSVSEAIAASTAVATAMPTAAPAATTTPFPVLEAKNCVTRTVAIADWQKPTFATGVQQVGGGIAVWGLSHIATKQDLSVYMGLDQIRMPFTITVKTLSSVKPAPGDMWVCFQNDVNAAQSQCTSTMKGARSVNQVDSFSWKFSYPFTEQPSLPQLRLISLAKQKSPLTIQEIEFCQG